MRLAAILLIFVASQVWSQQAGHGVADAVAWKKALSATYASPKRCCGRNDPDLVFTDEHTLVVYQTIETLAFSRSGESPSYAADLLRFQAETGTLLSHPTFEIGAKEHPGFLGRRSWPNTSLYYATGGVILQTGQWVRFLTQDAGSILRVVQPPYLPPNDPAVAWEGGMPSYVYVATSLSGKTIVIQYDYGPHSILQQYDGQTFNLVRQWEIGSPGHQRVSIDDNNYFISREPDLNRIYMTPFGGQLTTPMASRRGSIVYPDHWLSQDQIPPLTEGKHVTGTKVSQDTAVLAIQFERVGRCCPSLDIDPPTLDSRSIVYTYPGLKVLLDLPSSNKRDRPYAFALSPNGTKLALLDGDQLTVYKVPATH